MGFEVGYAQGDRPEAADLILARAPRCPPTDLQRAGTAVVDQCKPLAFRILEVERQPAVAFLDA